ncbi:MAG: STAS domain-containing protein [Thermoleophilia bacterium]|nr:STAS domain-containing protein [Thermoleophilia bacterium]
MHIEWVTRHDVMVLTVEGEIALGTAAELNASLEAALDQGRNPIVVDVAEVTYIDSGGFSVLHRIIQRLEGKGRLCLVGANPDLVRMFRIVGLTSQPQFVLYASLEEASDAAAHGEPPG